MFSLQHAVLARPIARQAFLALCVSLLATLLALPAAGALRIVSESPRTRVFRDVYEMLPACWKENRPVVVREVSDIDMDLLVGDDEREQRSDSVIDGYYQPGRGDGWPTITLRRSLRDGSAELVFAHEYAHYIWDAKLSEKQRADYRRVWSRQQRA